MEEKRDSSKMNIQGTPSKNRKYVSQPMAYWRSSQAVVRQSKAVLYVR
jgi:hypothetical protein